MVSGEVILAFEGLAIERPLVDRWDALLRIGATFSIAVNGQTIYADEEFPAVEFMVGLNSWALEVGRNGPDFAYCSLESEQNPFIAFRRTSNSWQVHTWEGVTSDAIALSSLTSAAISFAGRLYAALLPTVDLRSYLSDLERFALDRILARQAP